MATTTDSSVKPTTIIGSDSRFATTFLSTKYRDRAVNGEALMDKETGELFIKRVSDGKIVSFNQNKKLINNLVLDLQLLLLDNGNFVYPSENENAFYIVTNYDLVAINNEKLFNLLTDDVVITGSPNDVNKLTFTISGESNGFFCRHTIRDIDKAFIEFITNQYNVFFKNYTGENTSYLSERDKFTTNDKWENSNAEITYSIIAHKDDTTYSYDNIVDYITLNDDTAILFPDNIYTELGSFDYADITIEKIVYDKIHFMVNHKDEFGSIFTEMYDKFIPADGTVGISEFNINYFVDDVSDIVLLGNESIVGFLDVKHLTQCLDKLNRLLGQAKIHISETQPNFPCTWFKPSLNE